VAATAWACRRHRREFADAIKPGDDPVAVARRLLRTKWDKHGAFYDDIRARHAARYRSNKA